MVPLGEYGGQLGESYDAIRGAKAGMILPEVRFRAVAVSVPLDQFAVGTGPHGTPQFKVDGIGYATDRAIQESDLN